MASEASLNSDSILDRIRKLSTNGGSLQDYETISAVLGAVRKDELEKIIRNCDVVELFMSMDLHQSNVLKVAITLAATIFSVIPLLEFIRSHESQVLSALKSDNPELVCFLLGKVSRDYTHFGEDVSCVSEPVIDVIAGLIVSDNISISQAAIQFFKSVANLKNGCARIYQSPTFVSLLSRCSKQEHFIRVCEMSADLFCDHPDDSSLIKDSGILKKVVEGLKDQDPLANLNYLEIAKSLALTNQGYEFLESNDTLGFLVSRVRDLKSDSLYELLLPGYLKFFGVVARQHPACFFKSSFSDTFVRILSTSLDYGTNPSVSLSTLEAIGYAAGSVEARQILNPYLALGGRLSSVFPNLGKLLQESPTEVCSRVVDCVGEFLQNPITSSHTETAVLPTDQLSRENQLSLAWAAALGGHALDLNTTGGDQRTEVAKAVQKVIKRLVSLARQPYLDIRSSALRTLRAVSTQPWGVNMLVKEPGLMEYLLNRATESGLSKTGDLLKMKFDIVSTILATSQTARDGDPQELQVLLQPQQAASLRSYLRHGVWGVAAAQNAVATEPI